MDVDSDIKGDAFEYFLKKSVTVGNDLGEYYTPRHIVKLIVDLVNFHGLTPVALAEHKLRLPPVLLSLLLDIFPDYRLIDADGRHKIPV